MPKTEILFQGVVENNFHLDAIKNISALDNISELIFCVAFARSEGIDLIFEVIDIDVSKVKFFLGVRNGITSAQALHELVKKDVEINCIDTGSSGVLFHPKIYLSSNAEQGYAVIGSANLTQSGLSSNIETSFLLNFDFSDEKDTEVFQLLKNSIINIPVNHPENSQRIDRTRQIISMLWDGVVTDERVVRKTTQAKKSSSQAGTPVPPIKTYKKQVRSTKKRRPVKEIKKLKNKEITTEEDWILMWESNGLTERDLNIPTGPNTNPTGSMLFKKGNMDDIDQRHYFREDVFVDLDWSFDPNPQHNHLERSEADFVIEIQGVRYGTFTLKLTHNSKTDTAAYRQRNSMTQIHWGDIRSIIAKEELLDEKMRLYKLVKAKNLYKIEIG